MLLLRIVIVFLVICSHTINISIKQLTKKLKGSDLDVAAIHPRPQPIKTNDPTNT
jgi:hypothetical protein